MQPYLGLPYLGGFCTVLINVYDKSETFRIIQRSLEPFG